MNKQTIQQEQLVSARCVWGEQSRGRGNQCMEEVAGAGGSSYNLVGIGITGKLISVNLI